MTHLCEIANDNFAEILLLIEWLHGQLPRASSLFHLLKGLANKETEKEELSKFHVHTDDTLGPQFVCVIRVKPGEVSCCLHTENENLPREIVDELAHILESLAKESGLGICFMALNSRHFVDIKKGMERVGLEYRWKEPAALYHLSPSKEVPAFELTDSYKISETFQEEDLVFIDSTWKYRSANSLDMIRKMVAAPNQPQVGVRNAVDGALVAWVMTYGDKSLGMMYTLPEHRSKGLGKAVAALAITRYRDFRHGSDAFCYIVDGNTPSVMVYEKTLGFQKVHDTYWCGFARPN